MAAIVPLSLRNALPSIRKFYSSCIMHRRHNTRLSSNSDRKNRREEGERHANFAEVRPLMRSNNIIERNTRMRIESGGSRRDGGGEEGRKEGSGREGGRINFAGHFPQCSRYWVKHQLIVGTKASRLYKLVLAFDSSIHETTSAVHECN